MACLCAGILCTEMTMVDHFAPCWPKRNFLNSRLFQANTCFLWASDWPVIQLWEVMTKMTRRCCGGLNKTSVTMSACPAKSQTSWKAVMIAMASARIQEDLLAVDHVPDLHSISAKKPLHVEATCCHALRFETPLAFKESDCGRLLSEPLKWILCRLSADLSCNEEAMHFSQPEESKLHFCLHEQGLAPPYPRPPLTIITILRWWWIDFKY